MNALHVTVDQYEKLTSQGPPTEDFIAALAALDWNGSISNVRAARVVLSTDNSIYQRLPQAVLEPRNMTAMAVAMTQASRHGVVITAGWGGTGTNGQSLTDSVVIDCSRHMNRIVDIDAENGIAVVEPGVVLDHLNDAARPLGWMFGPSVSTATRATLGGMVSTEASDKGSRRFGRTSDHLVSADIVWSNGTLATVRDLSPDAVEKTASEDGVLGILTELLHETLPRHSETITQVFPKMNRGLTDYNLDQLRQHEGDLSLTRLLAGSEGTLALIGRLTLRLSRIPRHRGAALIGYTDCDTALRAIVQHRDFDSACSSHRGFGQSFQSWAGHMTADSDKRSFASGRRA